MFFFVHVDGDVVNGMAAYQPIILVCVLCGGRMKTLHPASTEYTILILKMHGRNIKKRLFVLFIFCNPTDILVLVWTVEFSLWRIFRGASCSSLLAILASYFCNTVWWKKAELHHDGDST
jgi:hypothetical protein